MAIKVEIVKERKEEGLITEYPCVGISRSLGTIVLFYADGEGIVLERGEGEIYSNERSLCFKMSDFKKLDEPIIIQNE